MTMGLSLILIWFLIFILLENGLRPPESKMIAKNALHYLLILSLVIELYLKLCIITASMLKAFPLK